MGLDFWERGLSIRFGDNSPWLWDERSEVVHPHSPTAVAKTIVQFNGALSKFLKLNEMSVLTSHLCITSVPEGAAAAHVA